MGGKWQYHIEPIGAETDSLLIEQELDRLGEQAWELVGVQERDGTIYLYMKRPCPIVIDWELYERVAGAVHDGRSS